MDESPHGIAVPVNGCRFVAQNHTWVLLLGWLQVLMKEGPYHLT